MRWSLTCPAHLISHSMVHSLSNPSPMPAPRAFESPHHILLPLCFAVGLDIILPTSADQSKSSRRRVNDLMLMDFERRTGKAKFPACRLVTGDSTGVVVVQAGCCGVELARWQAHEGAVWKVQVGWFIGVRCLLFSFVSAEALCVPNGVACDHRVSGRIHFVHVVNRLTKPLVQTVGPNMRANEPLLKTFHWPHWPQSFVCHIWCFR